MKVQPQDKPKAIALVIGIGICFIAIGSTLLKTVRGGSDQGPAPAAPLVAGDPVQTAALTPQADPMQYIKNLERWSQPPVAPPGDPFREVLPRGVAEHFDRPVAIQQRPPSEISGRGFQNPLNPTLPNPGAMIDFPEIKVQGVLVDPGNASMAVLVINNQTIYAKAGDILGNSLKMDKVTESGAWIWAGKEHAFIEVSRSYKPTGIAPPAPPKPAPAKRRSGRRGH